LLLLLGAVRTRYGTLAFGDVGGLFRAAPLLAAALFLVGLSIMGIPGTGGFPSGLMILLGASVSDALGRWSTPEAMTAAFAFLIAALYVLRVLSRTLFAPARVDTPSPIADLDAREATVALALISGILILGWFPETVLSKFRPSVVATLNYFVVAHEVDPELLARGGPVLRPALGSPLEIGYPGELVYPEPPVARIEEPPKAMLDDTSLIEEQP
jgi:NADH-quinone oxidoreductase subunit M